MESEMTLREALLQGRPFKRAIYGSDKWLAPPLNSFHRYDLASEDLIADDYEVQPVEKLIDLVTLRKALEETYRTARAPMNVYDYARRIWEAL